MGLRPKEYYSLTPVEFGLMYSGYKKKEISRKKDLRLLSFFVVKGWADPKDMPKTVEEWWPIDEEDKKAIENNMINIASWSDEKRKAAEELIRNTVGG